MDMADGHLRPTLLGRLRVFVLKMTPLHQSMLHMARKKGSSIYMSIFREYDHEAHN